MPSMSPRSAASGWTAEVLIVMLAVLVLAACGSPEQANTPAAGNTSTAGNDAVPTTDTWRTPGDAPARPPRSGLTIEDGFIPDGAAVSLFDNAHPAIANLAPALREAMQQAAIDASNDGVEMMVTSAWRSAHYQETLLTEAIAHYGSVAEARKWVNTPERSTHVTGDAVDIGPVDANEWLRQHGYIYGLCQTYANEPWHFELMVAPGDSCPEPLSDASEG